MKSNCLIDTELFVCGATTANKSRNKPILELEVILQHTQAHSSATVMRLSVSKLHNFTLSPHLYEFSISPVL